MQRGLYGTKKVLSKEEWGALRPFIQLHYIDENKTFKHMAGLLRERDGFEPS
jgi:hypothetical protein